VAEEAREHIDLVGRFYAAFNAQDIDAFAAALHPEVELQTARGVREGIDQARAWATKAPTGKLDQRVVIDELREAGEHVLALVRRQWWWEKAGEGDGPASEDEVAALFSFRDGLICRWQPFADRDEGLAVLERLASANEPS
jgi:ketosteroid isomerase-like protein